MIKPRLKIFDSSEILAKSVAAEMLDFVKSHQNDQSPASLVLSGGRTPRLIYKVLAGEKQKRPLSWDNILFFWGDERCVPPDHPESNYGMAYKHLLKYLPVPRKNIFRMRGEEPPELEAERYSQKMMANLKTIRGGIPVFDWVFLGMGTDGHTASLFPEKASLQEKKRCCVATEHPTSGQRRLTLTLPVLNNARRVTFLITGADKADISSKVYDEIEKGSEYPAGLIDPRNGLLEWYLDKEASAKIAF
jgi:6-phosphogluconolactonase